MIRGNKLASFCVGLTLLAVLAFTNLEAVEAGQGKIRGAVIQILDSLGITTGGVYSGGGGGTLDDVLTAGAVATGQDQSGLGDLRAIATVGTWEIAPADYPTGTGAADVLIHAADNSGGNGEGGDLTIRAGHAGGAGGVSKGGDLNLYAGDGASDLQDDPGGDTNVDAGAAAGADPAGKVTISATNATGTEIGPAAGGHTVTFHGTTDATITDGVISVPSALLTEAAAPGTPASGLVSVYAKTDGLVYSKDDAGTETRVSGRAFNGVRVELSSDQTITTGGSGEAIAWSAAMEDYDTDGWHSDTDSSKFFVPTSAVGSYVRATFNARWASDTGGNQRNIRITHYNSSDVQQGEKANVNQTPTASGVTMQHGTWEGGPMASGDYIEFRVYHDKGTDLNLASVSDTWAAISVIGGP